MRQLILFYLLLLPVWSLAQKVVINSIALDGLPNMRAYIYADKRFIFPFTSSLKMDVDSQLYIPDFKRFRKLAIELEGKKYNIIFDKYLIKKYFEKTDTICISVGFSDQRKWECSLSSYLSNTGLIASKKIEVIDKKKSKRKE